MKNKYYIGLRKNNKTAVVQVTKGQAVQALKRWNRLRPHSKIITNFR